MIFNWDLNGEILEEEFMPESLLIEEYLLNKYDDLQQEKLYLDQEFSAIEIILDIQLTSQMQKILSPSNDINSSDNYENKIIESYFKIPIYIVKVKFSISEMYQNKIINQIDEKVEEALINYIESIGSFLTYSMPIQDLGDMNIFKDYPALIYRISKINNIINETSDSIQKLKSKIRYQLSKIPEDLNKEYGIRYWILLRNKRRYIHREYSLIDILLFTISNSLFENWKEKFCYVMVKCAENMQRLTLSIENYILDPTEFLRKSNNIRNFMDECEKIINRKGEVNIDGLIVKYFKKSHSRCAAIMDVYDQKAIYRNFAFSGLMDYTGKCKARALATEKIKQLADKIQKGILDDQYKWASLVDNVRLYGTLNNEIFTPISNPIKLENDTYRDGHFKDYACCERKMLADLETQGISGEIILFSRWYPCSRCLPALSDYQKKIKCYYLCDTSKEYENYVFNGFKKVDFN